MFVVNFDLSAFEKQAKRLQAARNQVPFALSLALNQAVTNTRRVLVEHTWPQHVTARNKTFVSSALRTQWSTKRNLRVEIFEVNGRAILGLHAYGGVKKAQKGRLAIPPAGSRPRDSRVGRGVRKNLRPAAIITSTPKRALRVTPRGIFVGKGGRLHMMYAFKTGATQPADVPFAEDFRYAMTAELRTSFPAALARAMSTRR